MVLLTQLHAVIVASGNAWQKELCKMRGSALLAQDWSIPFGTWHKVRGLLQGMCSKCKKTLLAHANRGSSI
jgi:hypothetical protein